MKSLTLVVSSFAEQSLVTALLMQMLFSLLDEGMIPNCASSVCNLPEAHSNYIDLAETGANLQRASVPPMFPREYLVMKPIDCFTIPVYEE
jgi:hypothetical protein